jgi:hypothetical protein
MLSKADHNTTFELCHCPDDHASSHVVARVTYHLPSIPCGATALLDPTLPLWCEPILCKCSFDSRQTLRVQHKSAQICVP